MKKLCIILLLMAAPVSAEQYLEFSPNYPTWTVSPVQYYAPDDNGNCQVNLPIKKTIASGLMQCTVLACVGKLVCPEGGDKLTGADCVTITDNSCNHCTASTIERCFSEEQFKELQK